MVTRTANEEWGVEPSVGSPARDAAASRTGRLLVVDDEPELVAALREVLQEEGFEVEGCVDPAAALAVLRPGGCDLILSDLMMPEINGIELLRRARQIDPRLTGVIMTGQGSIPAAVEAMQAGAADFILKPFRMNQMLPVIDRALEAGRLRAENERLRQEVERLEAEQVRKLRESHDRLATLAMTDPLTGLANRRAFDAALTQQAALADREGRPLSLVMLDVDGFKAFNDAFGHPAGDDALGRVAAVVMACSRAADVAARLGGEEFAILTPGADLEGAAALAERARATVAEGPWPLRPVTVSAGVATLGQGPGAVERLVVEADSALFQAKRAGRNRVATAR